MDISETMWTPILILAAVAAVVFMMKKAGQISVKDAAAHLRNGAPVVDVRSPGEFNSGHLPNALNFPLDEIEAAVPRRFKDKSQVLLLHCLSGMRSGMAQRKLKSLGYANVFNLGSLGRAQKIADDAKNN
jgi:phage shock protein E